MLGLCHLQSYMSVNALCQLGLGVTVAKRTLCNRTKVCLNGKRQASCYIQKIILIEEYGGNFVTEKKNNENAGGMQKTDAASFERTNLHIPEGFTEKLKNRTGAEAGENTAKNSNRPRKPRQSNKKNQGEANKAPVQDNKAAKPSQNKGQPKKQTQQPKAQEKPRQEPTGAPQQQRPHKGRLARPKQPAAAQVSQQAVQTAAAVPSVPSGKKQTPHNGRKKDARKPNLKIISLGGLGEIGKNITVYECGDDIFIVDCGLAFPDNDLLGVDLVIPDFTYLERNRDKIRGIVITHGHEDHIGGIPYLLKQINMPVYGTRLTLALLECKFKEHGLVGRVKMNVVKPGDSVKLGCMSIEFIHVNHSIPDACSLAITTPAGVIIQTGDFKIDYTPISGTPTDLGRFAQLGGQGVLALLIDSTNAEKPGSTPSERIVGESFDKLFKNAGGRRIVIATFASNIQRIQQIVDAAEKDNRKVAVFGRSMLNTVAISSELGYLTVKEGTIIDIDQMRNYTDEQLVLITTGSQGEPMSALTRMSTGDHRKVHIGPNDYIIISATPIPGNEKLVGKVVNELMKLGADVIYERMYDVHVSGHACQDEIKMILNLTRPKFFMPVHGEFKHLMKCAGVAKAMGIDSKHIVISDIGKVVETDGSEFRITGMVPSGRVLVDGLGVGDVGSVVLRDRKLLSEDGLIVAVVSIDAASGEILAGPDLVSRGFVYVRESEEMMAGARTVVADSLNRCKMTGFRDWGSIKGKIRDELSEYIYTRTKRKPMILPVIQEIE